MKKKFLDALILSSLKFMLSFRYRITYKGIENLTKENLKKPGGVLFLPNHPSFVTDPAAVSLGIWKKYPLRPMVAEYMFNLPLVNFLMRYINALAIPDMDITSSSFKKKRNEKAFQEVIKGLKEGDNFLLYPAGRTKSSELEIIGGASGVHRILQEAPQVNIVLVRTKGLFGSLFSRAQNEGKAVPLFPALLKGIKTVLKNGIFFTPKREITIEYFPAPPDFPYKASRLELNRYLENWYNAPDGLKDPKAPGDSIILVPYQFWSKKVPTLKPIEQELPQELNLNSIPEAITDKVIEKLSELTEIDKSQLTPEKNLSKDLGLDSLDIGELAVFLEDEFDVPSIPLTELTTVGKLLLIASKEISITSEQDEEKQKELDAWLKPHPQAQAKIATGDTIPEAFLNAVDQFGKKISCTDLSSGNQTYSQMKLRVLILAEVIRRFPEKNIGIMLPASVGASLCILATQLAGKVPVMINWTLGSKNIDAVVKAAQVKTVLTSWSFVDRLNNVDLDVIEDKLFMLEDLRKKLTLIDKLRAFIRSKKSTRSLLKIFKIDQMKKEDHAVILFTSGTESTPKGVPLTHHNILSNLSGVIEAFDYVYTDDIIFSILPPFHSFGFAICTLVPLLSGMRVAFYPNPTDGKKLAKGIDRWKATVMIGAPTFLKKLFKAASKEQISTLRLIITGAEKAPEELFDAIKSMNLKVEIVEGYGITECSPVLTMTDPRKGLRGVGHPAPGVELFIINPENKEALNSGKEGLILARGPNIFSGYLNKSVAPPFLHINGNAWYNTGDMGYLDKEGFLFITGRLKRFIKVGGEMISLASIEDALLKFAKGKGLPLDDEGPSLAVIGKEIPGEKPKIFVFAKFSTTVDELNRELKRAGFSNLVKISHFQKVDEIPLMGTGKVFYRELEAKYMM